jgi:hypothetical protein
LLCYFRKFAVKAAEPNALVGAETAVLRQLFKLCEHPAQLRPIDA